MIQCSSMPVAGEMDKAGIPYTPACAAMFLWVSILATCLPCYYCSEVWQVMYFAMLCSSFGLP